MLLMIVLLIVIIVLSIVLVNKALQRDDIGMAVQKIIHWAIFILSVLSLIISLVIFGNIGHYVSDYGTSTSVVYGGDFWNIMDWLRLLLLLIVSILSGVSLFKERKD